jgi:hypothetical protein
MIESPFLFLPNPKALPQVNRQCSLNLNFGMNHASVQYCSQIRSKLLIQAGEGQPTRISRTFCGCGISQGFLHSFVRAEQFRPLV